MEKLEIVENGPFPKMGHGKQLGTVQFWLRFSSYVALHSC